MYDLRNASDLVRIIVETRKQLEENNAYVPLEWDIETDKPHIWLRVRRYRGYGKLQEKLRRRYGDYEECYTLMVSNIVYARIIKRRNTWIVMIERPLMK